MSGQRDLKSVAREGPFEGQFVERRSLSPGKCIGNRMIVIGESVAFSVEPLHFSCCKSWILSEDPVVVRADVTPPPLDVFLGLGSS